MKLAKEKRLHLRKSFNALVLVDPHDGEPMKLIGTNYSMSGMALNSPIPLKLGEFIDLRFKINDLAAEEYNMTAEVVQNQKQNNMYVTGIRFLGELAV